MPAGEFVPILVPRFPECWDACGVCSSGDLQILEVLVKAGDTVQQDQHLIVIETSKTLLEIPSPHAGTVLEVFVNEGERPEEGMPILLLEAAD